MPESMSYFLKFSSRNADRSMSMADSRSWTSKPRYTIRFPATITHGGSKMLCNVVNVSEEGLFILPSRPSEQRGTESIRAGDFVQVEFSLLGIKVSARAQVAHVGSFMAPGVGFRFLHTPDSLTQLRRIARALFTLNVKKRTGSRAA